MKNLITLKQSLIVLISALLVMPVSGTAKPRNPHKKKALVFHHPENKECTAGFKVKKDLEFHACEKRYYKIKVDRENKRVIEKEISQNKWMGLLQKVQDRIPSSVKKIQSKRSIPFAFYMGSSADKKYDVYAKKGNLYYLGAPGQSRKQMRTISKGDWISQFSKLKNY